MVISTGSFPKALQGKEAKKKDKAPPLFTYGKKKAQAMSAAKSKKC